MWSTGLKNENSYDVFECASICVIRIKTSMNIEKNKSVN